MSQFAVGEVLAGKYQINAVLGAGGMGTVYRARQIDLGRDVAIKVPLPAALEIPGFLARFSREAKLVAKLVHDNIVQVYEYQESPDSVYIVMEYVEGQDMKTIVTRPPTGLTVKDFATMLRASLDGLGHAHEFGIVHRDIKPHNIMVQQRAKGKWRVKIMDFGIAHLEENANLTMNDQQLTATGQAIGTPSYMSPEQIRGMGISGASDIYSFGCVIFYVFTRQTPFSGTGFTIAAAHLSEAPPPLRARVPMLPEAAEKLVYKCLEKDPARRPQEAAELGQELYESLQPIFDVPMSQIWPMPKEQAGGTEALRPTAPLANTQSRSDPTIQSQLGPPSGATGGSRLTDPGAATISEGPIPGYRDPAPASPQQTGFTGGTQTSPSQLSEPTIPYREGAASPAIPAPAGPATVSPKKALLIAAAVIVPLTVVGAVIAVIAGSGKGPKPGPDPTPTPTVVVAVTPTLVPSPTPTLVPPTPAPGEVKPTAAPPTEVPRPTAVPATPAPTVDPVIARVESLKTFFAPTAPLADRVRIWEDAWRDEQLGDDPRMIALADDLARQITRAPEMVAMAGGAFTMGAPETVGSSDERPQHNVRLAPYEIGASEVTALEFSTFLNAVGVERAGRLYIVESQNNVAYSDTRKRFIPVEGRALHPANGVSWEAAKAYGDWLSTETKRQYRLPTEAEWENAASGRSGQVYPWGSADPDQNRAQFNSDGTVPVTEKSAGQTPTTGLRHMAGNVAEWCLDWYASETYESNKSKGAENPRGPELQAGGRGARKVLRGGGFEAQSAQDLRLTRRERLEPDKRNADVGFRLVREAK